LENWNQFKSDNNNKIPVTEATICLLQTTPLTILSDFGNRKKDQFSGLIMMMLI